jgi:hypothetical protein
MDGYGGFHQAAFFGAAEGERGTSECVDELLREGFGR